MKKLLALISILTLLLVACGGGASEQTSEDNVVEDVEDERQEEEEVVEEEIEEDEPIDVTIDVDEELQFKQFDVNMKKVKVYEKDGILLADISFDWRNKARDYATDKMSLFVATQFEVKQGDETLEEINDSWNPENKGFSNDVFFQNTLGGLWSVSLTYELVDETTPIDIIFTPNTETEDSETITINIP